LPASFWTDSALESVASAENSCLLPICHHSIGDEGALASPARHPFACPIARHEAQASKDQNLNWDPTPEILDWLTIFRAARQSLRCQLLFIPRTLLSAQAHCLLRKRRPPLRDPLGLRKSPGGPGDAGCRGSGDYGCSGVSRHLSEWYRESGWHGGSRLRCG